MQPYLWFLKLPKVDWEADASTYGSPAPSFQFGFEKQISSLLLKVGFRLNQANHPFIRDTLLWKQTL